MAWSPYKESVIDFVRRNPGCSKWDVARHCTHNSQRCPSKQYYIVNTALRNGWITGTLRGRAYELYVAGEQPEPKMTPADGERVIFTAEGGFRIEKEQGQ